jgi:HSP90 family molecular chaperone
VHCASGVKSFTTGLKSCRVRRCPCGAGLQGEFGIGLLSFWTVGDSLTMTSTGTDQRAYQMTMSKGDSRYEVSPRRVLFAEKGNLPISCSSA